MNEIFIRVFILLVLFAAVFLLSQLAIRNLVSKRSKRAAVNYRLKMIREGASREAIMGELRKNQPRSFDGLPPLLAGMSRSFQRTVFASGITLTPLQFFLAIATAFAVIFTIAVIAAYVSGFTITFGVIQLLLVFAAALAIGVPLLILKFRADRQRKAIERQFPVALDIFVRALRSGHPIASAIELLTHEMEDPIGSEFGLVNDEVTFGADLTSALAAMADRWDLEDMRMFVVSLSVQSETGGNLAEILENLSDVIRARAQMYMKVRALSSEGRMTGWMLSVLPVFAFVSVFLGSPGFYLEVADDMIFIVGAIGLLTLYFIGVFTIRKMVDLKV